MLSNLMLQSIRGWSSSLRILANSIHWALDLPFAAIVSMTTAWLSREPLRLRMCGPGYMGGISNQRYTFYLFAVNCM